MSIATILGEEPRWKFMWQLAFAIYIGCKVLTWWTTPATDVSLGQQLGYVIVWPGLDAKAFFHTPNCKRPSITAWLFAAGKLLLGIAIIVCIYPRLGDVNELVRGWVGMIGLTFALHFGVFHLLSLAWQSAGVNARPIMDWPILATSVSDFWGQRWNRAFRDLTYRYVFRPLTTRCGAKAALALGFLFSGIVHDAVISLPAGGGYGGPTVFFVIQAAAIFAERSALGQRLGLGRGLRGWAFALIVLLGPAWLLFHPPFLHNVIVPFLDSITEAHG